MVNSAFNIENLLSRLHIALQKEESEYIALLFDDKHEEALSKLTKMDVIEAHINRVEELQCHS